MKHLIFLRLKRYIPQYIIFTFLILLVIYAKSTTIPLYENMEIDKYFWEINLSFNSISLMDGIIALILLITPYAFIQIAFGNILYYDTSTNGSLIFTRYRSKKKYFILFMTELFIHMLILVILTFLIGCFLLNFIDYDLIFNHESWKFLIKNFYEVYASYLSVAFITNFLTFVIQDLIKASIFFNTLIICSLIFMNYIKNLFLFKLIPILTPIIYEEYTIIISFLEITIILSATFYFINRKEFYN